MNEATIPDWISSIAAAAGAIAVIVGLFRANRKVDEVQSNLRLTRRAEVAEDLIALALNVEDAMKDIRNPFDQIPKDKVGDHSYRYQRRYDRIVKYNELFQNLREAQIKHRAIIGDDEVNAAVEDLFKTRAEVAAAIEILADLPVDEAETREDREQKVEFRRTLYGSFSDRDELGKRISTAANTIEQKLKPFARLEVQVKP